MKYISVALLFLIFLSCSNKQKQPAKGTTKKQMDTIQYIERESGKIKTEKVPAEGMLKWLYSTSTGKIALHTLVKRKLVSAIVGQYMNTKLSAKRIPAFIKEFNININEYQRSDITQYKTFNDFFYRKIKTGARPIGDGVVSPADGRILVFQHIKTLKSFFIKGFEFNLIGFLNNKELAEKYSDGAMAIVRLAPVDYHRFHFPASGIASGSTKINGNYFSVSPLALQKSLRILCENKRELSTLQTQNYGTVVIVEIGATMVGSIFQTYKPNSVVNKGDEKGYFAFGGSTLVLLFEKDKITFDPDLITNTKNNIETKIKLGQRIAE